MGFAKEIEDFINGYSAISKISGDAEDRKLRSKKLDAELEAIEAKQMEALAVNGEEYLPASQKAALRRSPRASSTAPYVAPTLLAPYGDSPGEVEEEEGLAMASGGLVTKPGKKAAIAIDEPEDNAGAAAARAQGRKFYTTEDGAMRPLNAPGGKARNTYGETAQMGEESLGKPSNAIKAAMDLFAKKASSKPKAAIDTAGGEDDIDLMTNRGAATPAEIKAIDAKIDPNGEMTPWQRGRQRLDKAYEYFVSRGEPEKAANVAARILLFDKMSSQARGTMAVQMISSGQAAEGAKMLQDAYNENIHDGSEINVQPTQDGKFSFTITKDGDVVEQGVGTAADMASVAGNVANGSEFVRRTAEAAAGGAPEVPARRPDTQAAPAAAVPTEAAPAATPAAAPEQTPADKPAAETAKKSKRDIAWAKKQYTYAAQVLKTWEDEVERNPTPENQARLKDAQIRLAEAEQDAMAIRLSTVKSKTADSSKIQLDFDEDLAKWREAAEPLGALPGVPKDGLRGAPKDGAPAATKPAAAAPTPAQSLEMPRLAQRRNADTGVYTFNGETIVAPINLKPVDETTLSQAKAALAAGKSRAGVIRKLLENGFDPKGL